MISISHYLNNEGRRLTLQELSLLLPLQEGVVWIDMEDPSEAEEETILIMMLNFHPLAVEDCQGGRAEEGHLPKVEDFEDYMFIIFNPIEESAADQRVSLDEREISTCQLSAFLSRHMLVTHHYKPLRSISNASQLIQKNCQVLGRGPDYVFQLVIDHIVDSYTPILDRLDSAMDASENEVFHSPAQRTMMRILKLKKNIMTIRRVAMYQREMLNRLSRGEFPLITENEIIYYRNVYDHLVRMSDLTESYRDVASSLLDAYLSVTSNRLNQVMKVLTIISTIFLPLSVITGFFGMNFEHLPGSKWEYGVVAASMLMLVVGVGMLAVFRWKKWL
jgi:magnesium transporter